MNELLSEMIRTYKMLKMKGEIDTLRPNEASGRRRVTTLLSASTLHRSRFDAHDVLAPSDDRFTAKDL